MGAPIGKGTQGQVIKGVRIQDDLPVVIKIMEDHFIKPWNMVAKMPVSAYLLRALNYPEQGRQDPLFLEYVDHFHVEKNWILVTEYEEHEWIDLYDYVRQRKERLTEFECLSIFGGIAQALMRLHSDGFTHNDIKGQFFVVCKTPSDLSFVNNRKQCPYSRGYPGHKTH